MSEPGDRHEPAVAGPADPGATAPDTQRLPLLWMLAAIGLLILVKLLLLFAATPLAVVDDQLQHIVPFQHFLPGHPLPRDEIVDFYLSENSGVVGALFAWPAALGIHPIAWSWVVGIVCAVLALLAMYRAMRAGGASQPAAAAATVLLLIFLASRGDDLVVGSRGIGWPCLLAALWALVADRRILFTVAVSIAAFIYPMVTVLALGTAGLMVLWRAVSQREPRRLLEWIWVPLVPAAIVLLFWGGDGKWGETIALATARTAPEFQEGGRTEFFYRSAYFYFLIGERTGLINFTLREQAYLLVLAAGALAFARPPRPLAVLMIALAAASVLLWAAAHLLLFKLYLPSRYATYGLVPVVLMLGGQLLGSIATRWRRGRWGVIAFLLAWPALGSVASVPRLKLQPFPSFTVRGPAAPGLIRALAADPAPGKVAGLSADLDFVSRFADRNIYWSAENALPYKLGYRDLVTARFGELQRALFASRPEPLLRWAAAERVAFILIDAEHLAPGAPPAILKGAVGSRQPGLPPRDTWQHAWLAGQRRCAREENGVLLFSVACLGRAAGAEAAASVHRVAPLHGPAGAPM